MRGEIVTLKTDKRCSDCGRTLTRGSKVRMYRKPDGSLAFYCLESHSRSGNQPNRVNQPSGDKPDVVSLLREMLETLREIQSDIKAILLHLKGSVNDEEPSGGGETQQTQSDEEEEFPF